MKKSSLSSELLDLSLSRCFLVFLDVFLEWDPEFVLDLSLCFLLLDRFVEVFDLFDFLDLVEFLDLKSNKSFCTSCYFNFYLTRDENGIFRISFWLQKHYHYLLAKLSNGFYDSSVSTDC